MGEDGRGSLDPGIASGLEFVVCYPNKFLEFYYAENPSAKGTIGPVADAEIVCRSVPPSSMSPLCVNVVPPALTVVLL